MDKLDYSHEDLRNKLKLQKIIEVDKMINTEQDYDNTKDKNYDEYNNENYEHIIDEDNILYQRLSKPTLDDYKYDNSNSENNTTTEFQSPIRGTSATTDNNPPTSLRYNNDKNITGNDVHRYLSKGPISTIGGQLNISNIPVFDSASDRTLSPQVSSPSDEDKYPPPPGAIYD